MLENMDNEATLDLIKMMTNEMFHPTATPEMREVGVKSLQMSDLDSKMAFLCLKILASFSNVLATERICVPTLLAMGEADVAYFAHAEHVLNKLQQGTSTTMGRVGHIMTIEDPARCAAITVEFVRKYTRARGPIGGGGARRLSAVLSDGAARQPGGGKAHTHTGTGERSIAEEA